MAYLSRTSSLLAWTARSCRSTRQFTSRADSSPSASFHRTAAISLFCIGSIGYYAYVQRNPVHAEAKIPDENKEGVLIKDQWIPFKLEKVEPYNHNTQIYHFSFPPEASDKGTGIKTAGAVLVKAPDDAVKDEKGKPVIRPYTPISPSEQTGTVTLMIKKYDNGKLTPYIASMKPGESELLFKGPIQKHLYKANSFDKGLCIAGGSGITPMYQLLAYSLQLPDDKTKWTLIFSNVTEKDILLKEQFDTLAKKNPSRLQVKYVVDKPPKGWKGETGYITADLIKRNFDRKDGEKVMAFVCGPPGQYAAVCGQKDGAKQGELKGALKDLGYSPEEVFKF